MMQQIQSEHEVIMGGIYQFVSCFAHQRRTGFLRCYNHTRIVMSIFMSGAQNKVCPLILHPYVSTFIDISKCEIKRC